MRDPRPRRAGRAASTSRCSTPASATSGCTHELAPNGEPLVGYVGRLAPEKELELLAHVDRLAGVRLVIVGGGPEEARLRALLPGAAFLGVLHGEDLSRAYATLDVFVHTGRHETYCQAAQEALASGVPVVAPRAGGPIDVVDEGAGYLYQPGNGTELASYVAALVDDPHLRAQVAAHGPPQRPGALVAGRQRPPGRALPRGLRQPGRPRLAPPRGLTADRAASASERVETKGLRLGSAHGDHPPRNDLSDQAGAPRGVAGR